MFSSTKTLARNPFLKQIIGSRALHSSVPLHSKVAVILAGSGVYDGSDIHESSAVYVHLSRADAKVAMFAPDIPQMYAINHVKGEPTEPNRNVLEESARIARGNIQDLSNLDVSEYDALIIPGGFGTAKNLSTFAVDGVDMKVNHVVEKVLKDFHAANKPIGLCCIAPVLVAKVIPGCEVTVGSESSEGGRWPFAGTAQAITSMGAKHVPKDVNEVHIDEKNKIVTTPAFMCETKVHEIFDGVGKMVKEVLKLSEK